VDNIEKSQVTTVEQRDDMDNFSQGTPFRKPRTQKCGKRKSNPDDFELRIIKALEETSQIDTWHSSKALFHLFKVSSKRRPLSFRWKFLRQ
jgi:hypothetical protein